MTHPLTPREKVEQTPMHRDAAKAAAASPVPTALASGSGDHAELARLAEWRDRLRADPGRAAHFGSPYADKPMQNGRTYWNIDLADDITTLLAENAALREREKAALKECSEWARKAGEAIGKLETSEAAGIVEGWQDRATEAERKLAEAKAKKVEVPYEVWAGKIDPTRPQDIPEGYVLMPPKAPD